MVYQSLKAAEILKQNKISAKVVNMHTIKPLDKEIIEKSLDCNLIFTIEEHNIVGGLGSAISEFLSTQKKNLNKFLLELRTFMAKEGNNIFT